MKIAITGKLGIVGTVLKKGLENKYDISGIDFINTDIIKI